MQVPGRPIGSLPLLLRRACAGRHRIVLACAAAEDPTVLEGARAAMDRGLVLPILIGDVPKIQRLAMASGISLDGMELSHEPDTLQACQSAVALCRSGKAGAMMKGAVPTAVVLQQVLERTNGLGRLKTLSHVAVFQPRGSRRLMLLTDAGVNIVPDVDCKLAIARNSIGLAHVLGIRKPRVALLAASEKVTDKMPSTVDAELVARALRQEFGEMIEVGGPYALDVAVSPVAASHKGIRDGVAGQADILIAPNIEAGNALYKSLTFFGRLELASLVLGAVVPLVVPSRSDSSLSKLYSIALALLAAGSQPLART